MVACLVAAGADIEKRNPGDHTTPLGSCVDAWSRSKSSEILEIARILLRAGASLDRVKGDLPAEQVLANVYPDFNEDYPKLFDLLARTRRRRALISTVVRLRSYATRDRLSAQVLILDRRALTTVQFYSALFGLPDELFRKVVRAL